MRSGILKPPSKDLSERVLVEVGFEDRLDGFSLRERTGPTPIAMYSFGEVVSFLGHPHPILDFEELEVWVRKTMRDDELADRIADAVKRENSDRDRFLRIRVLMAKRLSQCKTVSRSVESG